jgi:AraC-like DNA-binding protein
MTFSVGGVAGAGLERSCAPDEWVEAGGPTDGVERFRARLRGRPFSRHRHDIYAIGVTEEGVQAFEYRGTVERSFPGQVFVLHPDEPHDGRAGEPGAFGYRQIYVEPGRIAEAVRALLGRPAPLPFAVPVGDDPILAAAVQAAFEWEPEPLALDTVVLRLSEGLLRSASGFRGTLRRRVDLRAVELGREFLESRLAMVRSSELEALTGLDRYQFAKQFRAMYGTSPYRYSVMRRLDAARSRLRHGRSLVETALELDFADQAHFTRAFKTAFGMTPGRYARLRASHGPAASLSVVPVR